MNSDYNCSEYEGHGLPNCQSWPYCCALDGGNKMTYEERSNLCPFASQYCSKEAKYELKNIK